jgi:Domain of unknown function (DUF4124)
MKKDQFVKFAATLFAAPLLVALLNPSLHADEVYKWVDEQGITHYEERAPADKNYSKVTTYGVVPADAEKANQRLDQQRADKKSAEEKGLDYAKQKKISDEQARVRTENCKGAQNNLKTIQENARVRILGEDGEFRYLSEEERQQQIDTAKEMITANCNT